MCARHSIVKPLTPNDCRVAAGFSLVELVVGLAIVGVLLAVGAPAVGTYLANEKILATAQSFMSGLQQARAESIRRNTRAEFFMTDSSDITNPSVTNSASGKSWVVRAPDADNPAIFVVVNGKALSEGGGSKVSVNGTVASVTFNGLGGTNLSAAATFAFGLDDKACGPDVRCINVIVTPGGRSQICDPAVPATALTDSRRCIAT